MPTATSTEAGRVVASNAHARRQQEAADARAQARADTTTPLGATRPAFAMETLPEPPLFDDAPAAPVPAPAKPARTFSIATEIAYRGRVLTVTAQGMTIDEFCDLMDARHYASPAPLSLAAPIATADDLPDGFKLCQKHRAPMRPRNKQNDTWHSHNVGTAEAPCWCKGYRGSDSPGYEVD